MVTRILTLVRVRTAPAAIAGHCSSSTQNTRNDRRLFNDDEKIILPAAAASAVEAKKEDDKPGDLNRGDSQLREAEATVAVARPSNNVDNDPHHAASQRKATAFRIRGRRCCAKEDCSKEKQEVMLC
uniref:Uncharacterized protein n=1 Tax=Skeletonema marinoi TaxID=267567 RepID=A0A7S2LB06_9STRA|mmetsp:Transcript_2307/g.3691  ORF Transcript_2307/g.3691 Transcript_2307/m.3691 type:complete len:127 (+) Transcript_2307:94-474(+)